MRSYTSIIKEKIDKLNGFGAENYISCEYYEEYKQSSDF